MSLLGIIFSIIQRFNRNIGRFVIKNGRFMELTFIIGLTCIQGSLLLFTHYCNPSDIMIIVSLHILLILTLFSFEKLYLSYKMEIQEEKIFELRHKKEQIELKANSLLQSIAEGVAKFKS